jgi:hypothetical protein
MKKLHSKSQLLHHPSNSNNHSQDKTNNNQVLEEIQVQVVINNSQVLVETTEVIINLMMTIQVYCEKESLLCCNIAINFPNKYINSI